MCVCVCLSVWFGDQSEMGNGYSCKQLPRVSGNTGELLSEEMKGQWPQSSIGLILTKEIFVV